MKTTIKNLFLTVLLSFLFIAVFAQTEVKIQSPIRLAVEVDGQYLMQAEALPYVGTLNLPEIPSVPQPTMWTRDALYHWMAYPADAPSLPDYYEVEVHLDGMIWLAVIGPEINFAHWDALHVVRYRKYKTAGAYVNVPNPDYLPALQANLEAKASYLSIIKNKFVLMGNHRIGKKLFMLPVPPNHSLYNVQWEGFVNRTCLIEDDAAQIKALLGIK